MNRIRDILEAGPDPSSDLHKENLEFELLNLWNGVAGEYYYHQHVVEPHTVGGFHQFDLYLFGEVE